MTDSDNSEDQPIEAEETGTDAPLTDVERGRDDFYVVVIGASSGGKEALTTFFQNTPADSGMAFLVLQHSQDQFAPILVESLKRLTNMEVVLAKNGTVLNPNKVYIMPTEVYTSFVRNVIHLDEEMTIESRLAIDVLMNAVAEAKRENAIGVILSGRGFDGTDGIKAIKAAGGLVVVQEPETAEFLEMPSNAIATNLVDMILPPENMPAELMRYIRRLERPFNIDADLAETVEHPTLQKIFFLLRSQTGHDFSLYKRKTVNRRIQRRVVVNQLEDLATYYTFLQKNPDEVNRLFHEFLIGVTQFFRDPEAFSVLEEQVIPRLFTGKHLDSRIRIWVPGCSTGEEAYSLAILVHEYLETQDLAYSVQIFATDIDENAIQIARAGIYPLSISSHVPPRRLQRFFSKEGNNYHIRKQIREMVTFPVQSVVKDPPFSKLDLISCRNLLIYLRPELQNKLIPLFHYVLNPGGYLFLGTSETLSTYTNLFEPVNRKWKIFRQSKDEEIIHPVFEMSFSVRDKFDKHPVKAIRSKPSNMREVIERMLLEKYSPPAVVVNDEGSILYFHKRTEHYLEIVAGEVNINIMQMAREGLKLPISTAIRRVQSQKHDIVYKSVQFNKDGETHIINLTVQYLHEPAPIHGLILITFEPVDVLPPSPKIIELEVDPLSESAQRIRDLEQELMSTKDYLQAVVQELEASNEELKSVNEELNASNEELQSTNEELETASEELQSVNEELSTANSELENKLRELTDLNNDLNDLLLNVDTGIIFLDRQLRIRRFTPDATNFVNLISSDVGRPLADLVAKFKYDYLLQDARRVLDTLMPIRIEIQADDHRWYWVRIAPYETTGGAIVGVVVSFSDMTEQKQVEEKFRQLQSDDNQILALPFPKVERLFGMLETWSTRSRTLHSETDLIDQFCHLLISQGGYSMVWVRLDDSNTTFVKMGDNAHEDSDPTLVKYFSGDGHDGDTPSDDPTVLSSTSQVRDDNVPIVLPLRINGHTSFGTLHVYAEASPGVLQYELSILQYLANILAQNIQWLRQKG